MQLAEQHGEQRRLARAVRSDEAGFFTGVQGECGVVEKRLGAAREAELIEADHDVAG
ncbi:hypothetical protein OKW39_004128 [Paraburkholderia sp. MM6662-R1]